MDSAQAARIEEFRNRIVQWYELQGDKQLLWRRVENGWQILIASFLLRKTTVKQVEKIYLEFLKRYPSPQALLNENEEEVRELIKPLGIENQRSKLLLDLAREIVISFGGEVPCNRENLKKLPGVGDYIASEVLLGACGQPEPLLDRNMIRVIERVLGVKSSKKRPHTDKSLWLFAKSLVPSEPETAKKFNYGILDFARKICKASKPKCGACFLRDLCIYYGTKHSQETL